MEPDETNENERDEKGRFKKKKSGKRSKTVTFGETPEGLSVLLVRESIERATLGSDRVTIGLESGREVTVTFDSLELGDNPDISEVAAALGL